MLFQAILYAAAFLLCAVVCLTVRSREARQAVLLIASYGVYVTWGSWFPAVLLFSTVVNFLVGEWLQRKPSALALWSGMIFNLLCLGIFKYLPETVVHASTPALQKIAHLALPLGISFWTFQAMSYLFDLYRGEELDPSFIEFALYMAFFPVTISGPICRMPDMLPQFRSEEPTHWGDIAEGLRRIAIGIFMMQLAKLLGQGILGGDGVDSGFNRLTQWSGPDVWCLALGYGLQLFFDFAGYSHIAIGAARALGILVPENFARPFESANPSVFWTRWHMSLSFWIRDYVFLPLAVLRRELWWRNSVLVISMVLFGLWHRASLLFLLWGGYHGMLLVLHRQLQQIERRFNWEFPEARRMLISRILTIALISLGWIFFRANSTSQAGHMLAALLWPPRYFSHMLSGSLYLLVLVLATGYGITVYLIHAFERYAAETESSESGSRLDILALMARWRWFWIPPLYALALLFLLVVTLTRGASTAQFMYNKF